MIDAIFLRLLMLAAGAALAFAGFRFALTESRPPVWALPTVVAGGLISAVAVHELVGML